MTDKKTEALENLLRQWGDANTLRPGDSRRLVARIVQSLPEGDSPLESSSPLDGAPDDPRRLARAVRAKDNVAWNERPETARATTAALRLLCATAAVLAFVGLGWMWQASDSRRESTEFVGGWPPSAAMLQGSQLRDKSRLLEEMETLFDGQVAWLLETSDDLRVGVADRGRTNDVRPVAVRVIAQRRQAGDAEWTDVWAADVIARDQEVVRTGSDTRPSTRLAMWAYVLPDGMISVDLELNLAELPDSKLVTSSLLEDRRPAQIPLGDAGTDEFRLIQTATVLSGPVS